MQLIVAGQDRSAELGKELTRRAAGRTAAVRRLAAQDSALSLREATDEADFANRFFRLVRMRHGISTEDAPIPAQPGWSRRFVIPLKRRLWRLLRFQHDRFAFHQNVLNELLVHALEFQQKVSALQRKELEARVLRLENEVEELQSSRPLRGEAADKEE